MTCEKPTRRPTRIRAALLLACAVTASCASTQEADEQEAVEAAFSFTFEEGAEGWTAGFADYPVDFDPSIYELDSGHRPLPDGLEGRGLYIQGHNRSDDLFMFFKRQVGGLKPDAEYSAVLSLDLATNVAEGLVGIGGSPGESVFVKAGASTVEPVTPEDDSGYFRMNIDKGNQSTGGESMVVVGHVAHPALTGEEYRIKTLDSSASPVRVTADGEGRLWLIVGTDSGFEGLTALYYARIACTLTPANPQDSETSVLGFDRSPPRRGENPGTWRTGESPDGRKG
ncbi:MAG: hypothetical protein OXG13_18260 [Gemmatimonadaceae bacterium]|nr:hypothetical protein [Gemmatimonadaceae bacterium]